MIDSFTHTPGKTGNSSRTKSIHTLQLERETREIWHQMLPLMESIAFKGTIQQIRALVNDPKWDDKP